MKAGPEFHTESNLLPRHGLEKNAMLGQEVHLQELEREAYERGFEQGEKAGRLLGEQKMEPVKKAISGLLENLTSVHVKWLEERKKEIIDLTMIIATKIIHGEIQQDKSVVLRLAQEAISRTIKGSKMTLRVSPQDLAYLEKHLKEFPDIAMSEHFKIEADSQITRGGCVLISDAGEIDTTIENQIRVMRETLLADTE